MENAKRSTKKILSVILAIMLVFTALPLVAPMTAEAAIGDDLKNIVITRTSETQVNLTATTMAVGTCCYLSSTNATETESTVKAPLTTFMYNIMQSPDVSAQITIGSADTYLHLVRGAGDTDFDVLHLPIPAYTPAADYTLYYDFNTEGFKKNDENGDPVTPAGITKTDGSAKFPTFELDGFDFTTSAEVAMHFPEDIEVTFMVKADSVNNIATTNNTADDIIGLKFEDMLTIGGSGTLNISASPSSDNFNGRKYGIHGGTGNIFLIMASVKLNVSTGGNQDSNAEVYGIYCGELSVFGDAGSTISAKAGITPSYSFGIYSKKLEIDSNSASVISLTAIGNMCAIYADAITNTAIPSPSDIPYSMTKNYDGSNPVSTGIIAYSEGDGCEYLDTNSSYAAIKWAHLGGGTPSEPEPTVSDYTLYFDSANKVFKKNDEHGVEIIPEGITIEGDNAPYSLVMNGFNFKTTAEYGLDTSRADVKIKLADNSVNSIETTSTADSIISLSAAGLSISGSGTLNISAKPSDNSATNSVSGISAGELNIGGAKINVETGDADARTNAKNFGIYCTSLTVIDNTEILTKAGKGGESGSSIGLFAMQVIMNNTVNQSLLTAIGHSKAIYVEQADITKLPIISGASAVKYTMSENYDGTASSSDGGFNAILDGNDGTFYAVTGPGNCAAKWVQLGEVGPSITVGTQTGTLTYGDTVNKTATYAVSSSGFDPVPTYYGRMWTDVTGTQNLSTPTGLSTSEGQVTNGACTYTVTNSGAAAGDYYFLIYLSRDDKETRSKPAKITIGKATMTDTATTTKAVTVKADEAATNQTVTLPALPTGASYDTSTIAVFNNAAGLISGTPTIAGTTMTYNTTSKAEDTTANCQVSVTGAKNYDDYTLIITFTARAKEAVTITGVSADTTPVTYDGKAHTGYTGTPTSTNYSGTYDYLWTGTPASGGSYSSSSAGPKDAGTYKVKISVPDSNPTYAGSKEFSYVISPKAVTAQPKKVTVNVGAAMPTFELEYVGIVAGDTITPSVTPIIKAYEAGTSNEVTDTTTAGTYDLNWQNMSLALFTTASNYTVTKNQNTSFTVKTPAPPPTGVTVKPDPTDEGDFDITVPTNLEGEQNKVEIPLTNPTGNEGAGMVPVIVEPKERAGEFVPKSTLADGTVVFLVDETMKVKIVDNSKNFGDVHDEWFADNVDFVSARELFLGTSDTEFSPRAPMKRGQLATVLWRLELKPEESGSSFGDVSDKAYYTEAAEWGANAGIIEGVGNNNFAPNRNVSRQELVTMMFRYAKYLKMDTTNSVDLSAFPDGDEVSTFADEAMKWAVAKGIITGKSGRLDPKGEATRAEVAAIIQRFVEFILK